jgi:hypothetical protein
MAAKAATFAKAAPNAKAARPTESARPTEAAPSAKDARLAKATTLVELFYLRVVPGRASFDAIDYRKCIELGLCNNSHIVFHHLVAAPLVR